MNSFVFSVLFPLIQKRCHLGFCYLSPCLRHPMPKLLMPFYYRSFDRAATVELFSLSLFLHSFLPNPVLVRKEKKYAKFPNLPPPHVRGKYFTDCHARRHGMPTMCPFSPHCSHPTPFGHRSACGIRLCVSVFSLLFFVSIFFFVTFITCTCLKGFPRLAPRLQSPTTVQYASKHRQQQPHQKGPLEPVPP